MRRIITAAAVLAALSGCGSAAKTPTHDRSAVEIQTAYEMAHKEGPEYEKSAAGKAELEAEGRAAGHTFQAHVEACEGERTAALAWVKALQGVMDKYGEPGVAAALTLADEDTYKVEEAGKKVVALMPQTAEAVTRFDGVLGDTRRAAGEGLSPLTAATAEATAAWKRVFAACEDAF
jgi:hypothetical protein